MNSLMMIKRPLGILAVLAAAGACGKLTDNQSGKSDDASGIGIKAPASIMMHEPMIATVAGGERIKTFHWGVTDADGAPLLGCEGLGAAELKCLFEFPGTVDLKLAAVSRDGETLELTAKVDVLDPSEPADQAPRIMLKILEDDQVVASVATFHALESGAASVTQNAQVTFDLSGTTDSRGGADGLEFALDFGDGGKTVDARHSRAFGKVDVVPVTVTAKDAAGHTATKSFNLFVHCPDDGSVPPVSVDPAKISITDDPVLNYFHYAVDPAGVTGGMGQEPYKFLWDFNGDGAFDTDWMATTGSRQYTIFAGRRDVQLKVWDPGCNFFKKVDLGALTPPRHDFKIRMADGVPGTPQGPQIGADYFFIQAKLNGLAGNTEKSANGDYIATWKKGDKPQRVICDYKKLWPGMPAFKANEGSSLATFEIKGLNQYDRPDRKGQAHGMLLKIININDTTGTAASGQVGSDGALVLPPSGDLATAQYYTDEDNDSITRRTYQRVGDCDFTMTIKTFPPGPGTCSTNPDYGYPVTIDGTFSCPELKTHDGRSLEADQGAFYCEVAKVDACPVCVGDCPCVGGNCNGGGLPPQPK